LRRRKTAGEKEGERRRKRGAQREKSAQRREDNEEKGRDNQTFIIETAVEFKEPERAIRAS
jgi:hypothetical protein